MGWQLDKERPLCPQIYEQICVQIAIGVYKAGDKLPSVREMAVMTGVNPNTVQRSFEMLEREHILHSMRGSGWYVAEDIRVAQQTVKQLMAKRTDEYIRAMHAFGMDNAAIKAYIQQWNE